MLARRADVAREIAGLKRAASQAVFHDPERERQVLERLVKKSGGSFPESAVRAVFREVMSACLAVEEPLSVAYLGPEGTFSQMAARHLFGREPRYRECATIEAVFEAVSSGDCAYGVAPFENSSEGAVSMTSDALLESDLSIRQEYVLPITHCLLSRATSLAAIATVYSHPQALGQCRSWIAKHLPRAQVVQTTSTAAATREAKADDRAAAIASDIAAELHDVPVLRRGVQDHRSNATRFVVVAKTDAPRTGEDRTTLAFSVAHEHGALRKVLSVLEAAGVNLTRIESRPSRKTAWHYVFLVDVEGHRTDKELAKAIADVRRTTDFVKVVGSYPRAAIPLDPAARASKKKTKRG